MLGSKRKIEELRKMWKEEHLQHLEAKAVINELTEELAAVKDAYRSALEISAKYKLELEELVEINRKMEEELNGRDDGREV